jgi:hypothetical protein
MGQFVKAARKTPLPPRARLFQKTLHFDAFRCIGHSRGTPHIGPGASFTVANPSGTGGYNVTATGDSSQGTFDGGSVDVMVDDPPPPLAFADQSTTSGHTLDLTFYAGGAASSPDSWTIDWGDGTTTNSLIDGSGFDSHSYPNGIKTYEAVATAHWNGSSFTAAPVTLASMTYTENFEPATPAPNPKWTGGSVTPDDSTPAPNHYMAGGGTLTITNAPAHIAGTLSFDVLFTNQGNPGDANHQLPNLPSLA